MNVQKRSTKKSSENDDRLISVILYFICIISLKLVLST